ncbi:MAG: helix-hairpin-helix domain-containing protein, partial [Thermoplasmata archaeon]
MEGGFLDLLSEIPGVGRERARRLVSAGFSSLDSLVSANIEDIARAAGIGLGPATELREFFRSRYLQDHGPFLCSVCGSP